MPPYPMLLKEIGALGGDLFQKDFLLTWEKSVDEIKKIVAVAEALRWLRRANISSRCFDSGLAVSIFRDQSTRTRFSFFAAGQPAGAGRAGFGRGPLPDRPRRDRARNGQHDRLLHRFIGIRDDIFLGAGHTYMQEVAAALDDGFRSGVLDQRPNVINLQSDIDHPTQSMGGSNAP